MDVEHLADRGKEVRKLTRSGPGALAPWAAWAGAMALGARRAPAVGPQHGQLDPVGLAGVCASCTSDGTTTIGRAVSDARVAAIPLAIADARVRAQAAAAAAGLPHGALLNVDETRYGPYASFEGGGRRTGQRCSSRSFSPRDEPGRRRPRVPAKMRA